MERQYIEDPGAIVAKVTGKPPRKPKHSEADTLNEFCKKLQIHSHRHTLFQIFTDFCEMAALSLAALDRAQAPMREERYMQIVKRYTKEEAAVFPELLGLLVGGLGHHPRDFLGEAWNLLELRGNKGQVWSPYPLAELMAKMQLQDPASLMRHGFISMSEPACGPGVMCIAAAHALLDQGINFQQHLHVTAQDISPMAVHMTFVQLSLYGIPARVVLGDTLAGEERQSWFTPLHIIGGWSMRLALRQAADLLKGEAPKVTYDLMLANPPFGKN